MPYVTDMTKKPVEMLLGLINADNNFGLVEADVAIRNLTVITPPEGKTYNTSVEVDLLTDEVQDEYVEFKYKRISLEELFSLIDPKFREVDVPVAPTGLPVDNQAFITELLRKFGVAFNTTDFSWVMKDGSTSIIELAASAGNLAYTGSVEIDVEASLATRVDNTLLDGFFAPA